MNPKGGRSDADHPSFYAEVGFRAKDLETAVVRGISE